MGMSTHCPAYFADPNSFARLSQAFFRTPEFVEHERQFQSKRDRLRVHAMAAPDHRRPFESGPALPSPRKRGLQSQAKSETSARPTRPCAFLAGNNDRSLPQDKSER